MNELLKATTPYQLSLCRPEDAQALSVVSMATFLETYTGTVPGSDLLMHCRNQLSEEKYREWLESKGYRFALATIDGSPIGYVMMSPPDLPIEIHSDDIELKRIYILLRFQGMKLGATLMQWCVDQAMALGKKRLLLGVNAGNEAALKFYARQGFVEVGTRTFQVGTSLHHDLILGRAL